MYLYFHLHARLKSSSRSLLLTLGFFYFFNERSSAVVSAPMIKFKTPPFSWSNAGVLTDVLVKVGLGKFYTVGFPKPGWEPELCNVPFQTSHDINRLGCWVQQQRDNPIISLAGPSNLWVRSSWQACDSFMKEFGVEDGTGQRYPVPYLLLRASDDRFVHEASLDDMLKVSGSQRGIFHCFVT